ncbi:hypothetical protein TNIN_95301 [Trichonephila inaurata madagascariensis]|uniref:Uncharacterized protein n=1 Tax=Trichonephila inaurata madagascariensis TaxID=2747483 RepID=A0A8X6YX91_9ARAC|nr:hypothetical protein TNIN_95301 [Trichonephila inaurata madagascariensis]
MNLIGKIAVCLVPRVNPGKTGVGVAIETAEDLLRETRPTNKRARFLSDVKWRESWDKNRKEKMRSEGGRACLPIGRAAQLPLEERVARIVGKLELGKYCKLSGRIGKQNDM